MINMTGVTKEFTIGKLKVRALDGIDLSIKQGSLVAILGPSGSGKSTLMNIIGLLDPPTTGQYSLDQTNALALNDEQLTKTRREKIGFIFQKFNLLPKLDAHQNVELPLLFQGIGKKAASLKAAEMLEIVGLQDRMNHRPNELSGGQQQRVAIARALVASPPVILADEPTGALDSKTGREIIDLLEKLNSMGNTVIIITHDRNIAQHARRILYLSDGQIVRDVNNIEEVANENLN